MKIYIVLLLVLALTGCSDQNQNKNVETNLSSRKPSPTPTISDEAREKERKERTAAQSKAIDNFITDNYKGWALQGVSGDFYSSECEENVPCDLNLTNNTKSKIVTVILKRFYKKDGAGYWLVREAQSFDLSKAKIEQVKQATIESTIDDLSVDDVSEGIKDEIIQNYQENSQSSISE